MNAENLLIWNARGLNSRARRNVVRQLVEEQWVSLVSIQETKLDSCDHTIIRDMLGSDFDFFDLPVSHTCGGIVLAWNRCFWLASSPVYKEFSLTARLTLLATGDSWWITVVYGPQGDQAKIRFLEELRSIRQVCPDTWMICGDFNIIYKAEDKNNGRLHRRMMGRFRRLINDLALQDLCLKGRHFTWSSERDSPTLERLDRVLVSDDWLDVFPDHSLSALSTECSDHAPLLLKTDCAIPHFKRFRFENIWPRFDGFLETVATAWNAPVPAHELDAFRVLDIKLRATATALKSWSAKHVGNVRLQLAIAKEIVFRFDCAQENRTLAPHEVALRHKAKLNCLGLASLQRSIIRQRSRITYLTKGDANTKFFHLQACHMSRKNYIESVRVGDAHLVREEEKAEAFFKHFDDILGSRCSREANLDFTFLGLPVIDTSLLDVCF